MKQVKKKCITTNGEYREFVLYECLGKWGTHGISTIHFTEMPEAGKKAIAYKDEDFTNPHRVIIDRVNSEGKVFVSLD